MMESSEQCAYDGSLDPDDSSSGTERIVVAYEDYAKEVVPLNQGDDDQGNEQVLGYLDEENAALLLQSQGIELDGKRLILAPGTEGDEIYVFVSSEQDPSIEHSLEQSISENSDDNHTLAIQYESNNLEAVSSEGTQEIEVIETKDGLQNIVKNGTVHVEQAHELAFVDNNHYSSEALSYHVQEKDETTEMVFIPTTSRVISAGSNTRLLHLADVAHSEWATAKLNEKDDIEYPRKISEGSVIVSQMRADSDSHSIKVEDVSINVEDVSINVEDVSINVEDVNINVEDVSINVANEQDNNNSLHDEHMASEIEASSPAVEEKSPMLSLPSRDIENAVSVIHVTSSTLAHDPDWKTKNIEENENQTGEINQPDITLPAVSTNVTNLECSILKETLDSELSSQSPLIQESSNHSNLKDGTDTSNKDNNVNCETPASVEEPMDEDTSESIHFPPQLPSSENIDEDDSKQKDSISCNDNDSNTSMDVDQTQILDNKICDPSSENCENEMDFTNSEEACSEIETCPERTLSPRDNSESKSSFFSDNSQSKDHNLHNMKKIKSISPCKVKKVIDEYEFENSSSNLDQELSHNSSLDGQPSDMVNSDDISTEVDATKVSQCMNSDIDSVTGNLTFQGALTPVTENTKLNENPSDVKNNKTYFDNSQDLFDHGSCDEEEHNSSGMLKNANVKLFKNKQNSVSSEINHTDNDKKSDKKILAVKNGVNIDNKSKENDSVISNIVTSDETTVKPPQRTYIRKRKTESDSNRNIELFSLDDLSDPKDETSSFLNPNIFCSDDQKEQKMNDDNNLADEDGYVNLLPSDGKTRIKAKGTSSTVGERRTRSLRPRSSDHLEKIPDPVMDVEDSVSTCWGAYLMGASFKHTNIEKTNEVSPKASLPDVPKFESPKSPLKKRIRIPSDKKISPKNDSYKSKQQWDKLMKISPDKKNASSDKRKIREKVKKQVEKKLQNSSNFYSSTISMPQRKKGRPSKDVKKDKSSSEKIKTCGIRFLNDNSLERNNTSAIEELSTPSTSTQNLKSFQYNCSNCNFVSNKVNNLIMHLKYCKGTDQRSADMIEYGNVHDMNKRQSIRGDPAKGQGSTSPNIQKGSVDNDDDAECSSPSQEGISQENGEEFDKEDEGDNEAEELGQKSTADKKKFGYSENEIVWATVNNRFWPALVHKIHAKELVIYLIDRPNKGKDEKKVTNVHMKVSIDSLSEQLHSFDDLKWNKRLLEEAEKQPYNDLFVKAVQKSDSYIRKRFIYEKNIDGFTFFEIGKNVKELEETEVAEELTSHLRKHNNWGNKDLKVMKANADNQDEDLEMNDEACDESVDIRKLMDLILDGRCNEHVVGVFKKEVPSKRHELHGQKNMDKNAANLLKHMSWFGPFKSDYQMQIRLHDYFNKLFETRFKEELPKKDLSSYIYEVWIPEGIIKAISVQKNVTLLEAQIIFYKQDMNCVDVDDFPLDDEDS